MKRKRRKNKHDDLDFDEAFRRGTMLLHEGKAKTAVPLLERAHELEPTHVDAGINLAGAYILTKKFRRAVMVLEPLRDEAPQNAMLWTNLGAAYLGNPVLARDEEQQKAIEAFKQALAVNPIAPNVAYNIGLIYRDREETEKAIHWFRRAIQANPNDRDARNILRRLQNSQEESE